ncbi:MAG: amidohydrolase family protein [Algoriphagus sp.]|uniref:amidohydrolase family protein n=1 Tax=Algoriphagus sp. TaxID=1872435 RepID=UPI00260214C3|nr:amidohydrolase family protein [Algoriphagus sp.]MDG1278502.1 amidohydrolase family protein [Algoriphagus sp.]
MKRTLFKASVICMLLGGSILSTKGFAQSDPTGKKRVTDTYAITNATVFTAPGKAGVKSTVLIKDGIIMGVGSNLSIPAEARQIAGDSLFIYPGFIDGASNAGITKPKDPERPENFVSSNPPDEIAGITPWRSAVDQFAMDSKVEDLRKSGFTLIQVVPEGGMIAGKSAVMILGNEASANLIKENTALAASFRGSRGMYPGTAAGVMAKFRDVYKNAELTKTNSDKFASTPGVKRPAINDTYAGMKDVVSKTTPVMFSASSELEIRRVLKLQKELGFNLILTDLENYEGVINEIKASGAGVLIKAEVPDDKAIKAQKEDAAADVKAQYARVKEAYDKSIAQAGKLEAAGIPFAFTTAGVKTGDIGKSLKTMIDNGLSETAALAALTTNPAAMMGLSREAGTIEKGKMANLVLTTDSLFSADSQIKHVIADGYIFDYETKAKKKASEAGNATGAVKIAGNWDYTTESPAGSGSGIVAIQKEGNDFGGTITYDDPSGSGKATAPIKDVKLDGNSLSFAFEVNAQGMSIVVEISGKVEGNSMEGIMAVGQFGSFPFEATLSPSLTAKN